MRHPFAAIPVLLAGVLATGCTTLKPAADSPALEGTPWVLTGLPGQMLAAGATSTLRLEQGTAAGSDGCNRYRARYETQAPALRIMAGAAAATAMACQPGAMRQAQAFMAALSDTARYRIEGNRLLLMAADDSPRASLTAQSEMLAGTNWQAVGINNGRQAVVSLVAGSTVSLAFGADGQAAGSAGCNRFSARFEQDGARLRFKAPAATRRLCDGAGLMEQEGAFLQALQTAATMRLEGDRLELRTAEGALAVALVRDGAR